MDGSTGDAAKVQGAKSSRFGVGSSPADARSDVRLPGEAAQLDVNQPSSQVPSRQDVAFLAELGIRLATAIRHDQVPLLVIRLPTGRFPT